MVSRTARPARGTATREVILDTAERLFAERGIHAVSNRQISEAAGQGNSAAVGYHFGTKVDLVRAIAGRRADQGPAVGWQHAVAGHRLRRAASGPGQLVGLSSDGSGGSTPLGTGPRGELPRLG